MDLDWIIPAPPRGVCVNDVINMVFLSAIRIEIAAIWRLGGMAAIRHDRPSVMGPVFHFTGPTIRTLIAAKGGSNLANSSRLKGFVNGWGMRYSYPFLGLGSELPGDPIGRHRFSHGHPEIADPPSAISWGPHPDDNLGYVWAAVCQFPRSIAARKWRHRYGILSRD